MKNFNQKPSEWPGVLEEIQQKAGYFFHDLEKLKLALTHSSYAAESAIPFHPWNERLEFLGDAVLQLIVTDRLYHDFPDTQEGELTRARSVLVDEPANARNAQSLGINKGLMLGKGEILGGGRERPSLLGDAYEAFLGAVYLDGGFQAAREVVQRIYPDLKGAVLAAEECDNPKGLLQQFCQANLHGAPQYKELSSRGPSHAPHFVFQVTLPNGESFQGEGTTKKGAEQMAAKAALEKVNAAKADPQE